MADKNTGSLVDVLSGLSGDIQLGLMIEGQVVPLIVGTIKDIKAIFNGETIDYTVALSTGGDNLKVAGDNFTQGITLINEERAKAGLPPLEIPQPPTP